MENYHTPGPWRLRKPTGFQKADQKYDYGISAFIPHLNEEQIIAETFGQVVSYKKDAPSWANALLIAAAPDLFDALTVASDRNLDWDMMHKEESKRLLQDWRGKCFRAIAKAKGKSQ